MHDVVWELKRNSLVWPITFEEGNGWCSGLKVDEMQRPGIRLNFFLEVWTIQVNALKITFGRSNLNPLPLCWRHLHTIKVKGFGKCQFRFEIFRSQLIHEPSPFFIGKFGPEVPDIPNFGPIKFWLSPAECVFKTNPPTTDVPLNRQLPFGCKGTFGTMLPNRHLRQRHAFWLQNQQLLQPIDGPHECDRIPSITSVLRCVFMQVLNSFWGINQRHSRGS